MALVDISTDKVWLFTHSAFAERCQQESSGRLHLYFYTEPEYKAKKGNHEKDFVNYMIEKQALLLI